MSDLKVTVIVGGVNEPSNSNTLADRFIEGMKNAGITSIQKIRLKDFPLNHFTIEESYSSKAEEEENYVILKKAVESSSGVVFASPIWNFGVPAHLKNAIDRMGAFGLDAQHSRGMFNGKPFATLYTGGAPAPAWSLLKRTTSFVKEAIRYFGGTVVMHDFEGRCTKGKGQFGLVVDGRPATLERLRKKGEKYAKIVQAYHATGKLPLKQQLLHTFYMYGQRLVKVFS